MYDVFLNDIVQYGGMPHALAALPPRVRTLVWQLPEGRNSRTIRTRTATAVLGLYSVKSWKMHLIRNGTGKCTGGLGVQNETLALARVLHFYNTIAPFFLLCLKL